jgi:exodeoxyribonuclease V beta subunit
MNHLSAPGHLLGKGQAHEADQWVNVVQQALSAWGDAVPMPVQLQLAPQQGPFTRWQRPSLDVQTQGAKTFAAVFDRQWTIASFSRIARDLSAQSHAAGPVDLPVSAELPLALQTHRPADDEPAVLALRTFEHSAQAWHRFARGPSAGNFLHDQLEWLAADGFVLGAGENRRLQRACERAGFAEQAGEVQAWLLRVVQQPLTGPGVPLQALNRLLPEMEFWLPAGRLDAQQIDRLCRQHVLPGVPRPALPATRLHGMLMGFADLVFEHGGRYWVLDYKSNHLGPDDTAYTETALHGAMGAHRYDVQAALYLLALHRLLRARLGADYVPSRQLGGAVYLFLRGIAGPAAGCCTLPASMPLLQALDDMLAETTRQEPR